VNATLKYQASEAVGVIKLFIVNMYNSSYFYSTAFIQQ